MSGEERLRSLDFEQMSTEEMAAAKRMIARLSLPVKPIASRRTEASLYGARIDWRRTLRSSMRRARMAGFACACVQEPWNGAFRSIHV